jgi:hypothetical protein
MGGANEEPGRGNRRFERFRALMQNHKLRRWWKLISATFSLLAAIAIAAHYAKQYGYDLKEIAKHLDERISWFDPQAFSRDFDDAVDNCKGIIFSNSQPVGLLPPSFEAPVVRECPDIGIYEKISNIPSAWSYAIEHWYRRSGILENTITAIGLILPLLFLLRLYPYIYWRSSKRAPDRAGRYSVYLIKLVSLLGFAVISPPLFVFWMFIVRAPFYLVFSLSYGLLSLAVWALAQAYFLWLLLEKPIEFIHHYKGFREGIEGIKAFRKPR